jgi:hypothetical protein
MRFANCNGERCSSWLRVSDDLSVWGDKTVHAQSRWLLLALLGNNTINM